MSYEETIEGQESRLREAARLTEEATRKREEAAFKAERLRQALDRALDRAGEAEGKVCL